ncbi:MAG: EamA family transporter [Homoserinimonas sp.]|jgi:drug/metabolite transporter (DMT)-like permease|nr:EamA family transporter [Homoserinimonas sp.]
MAMTTKTRLPATKLLVVAAITVTVLAWASAFVVIRGVMPYFSGTGLALGRLVIGTALLALLLIGRRWVPPTKHEWLLIVLCGLSWFAVYNVVLNIAEQTLDAGTTAMLVNIGPLLIALGAGLFLGEGIPKWLAIGAAVAFFGVILIGFGMGAAGVGSGIGLFWALTAAITYAIGVLCQKPLLRRIPAPQVTWLACAIGAVACLPFAGPLIAELQAAPSAAIVGMIYLGVVPTTLAFSTWGYALARMPAGQLGVTTYIVPAIVVLLGYVAFHEIPTPLAIVGGAVCLAGVALSRRKSRAKWGLEVNKRSAGTHPSKTLAE